MQDAMKVILVLAATLLPLPLHQDAEAATTCPEQCSRIFGEVICSEVTTYGRDGRVIDHYWTYWM